MKRFCSFTILFLACLFTYAQEQNEIRQFPLDSAIVKGVLPNGMTYYLRRNDNPQKRAYFYIAQKVGSVQEEENQRGLAHFLEHMCFNGSEHFKGNALINFCQRIGVQYGQDLNAYTAADRTVYNINNVPTDVPENIDSCLLILYDLANGLTLDPLEIEKERGVIHEEWRMSSSAMMRIFERQLPTLMAGSRYANRLPIGLMSVVDSFQPQTLRDYYEKWYRPDLQGLIIVGDIDVKNVEQQIQHIFSKIPKPQEPSGFERYSVPNNNKRIIVVDKDKELEIASINAMFKQNAIANELRNSLYGVIDKVIVAMIQQMFSYRFEELAQNPDIPYTGLYAYYDDYLLASTEKALHFSVVPKDGQSKEATVAMLREIIRAERFGFTDNELERARTQLLSNLEQVRKARNTKSSSQYVQECVNNFLDGSPLAPFEEIYKVEKNLCTGMPLNAINGYLSKLVGNLDTNMVVLATYPDREGIYVPDNKVFEELLNQTLQEDIEPYKTEAIEGKLIDEEPIPGTIKKEFPADHLGYKTLRLGNGITVRYRVTDFDLSKITLSAISKGGMAKVATQDLDNAMILDDVMSNNGLGKFNSNDLRKLLTGRQVSFVPHLEQISESLNGKSSPEDLRTLMQLIYLSFTHLNYDTLNYRNVMMNIEQELANQDADPQNALLDSGTVRLHNNDPRHQPFTLERLKNVSYDGIRKIYAERFANPADFTFIFTGNIQEDSLRAFAKLYLASLPTTSKREKLTSDGSSMWSGVQECRFKRKMETPTTILMQVWHGNYPYTIHNDIVCEATGRILDDMNTEIVREKYSLTYSINTRLSMYSEPKDFFRLYTVAPIKPEKCDSALRFIDQNLQSLATNGVSQERLAKVKEQMLRGYENNLRSNRYWEILATDQALYGRDEFTGSKEALKELNSEDIQRFVRDIVLKQKNKINIIMLPE